MRVVDMYADFEENAHIFLHTYLSFILLITACTKVATYIINYLDIIVLANVIYIFGDDYDILKSLNYSKFIMLPVDFLHRGNPGLSGP